MQLIDYSTRTTWNAIVILGILAVMILIANLMRKRVRLIRKTLMPTAVIGGFLLLIIKLLGVRIGLFHTDSIAYIKFNEFLQILTYHGIAVGFIAMSLRVPENTGKKESKLVGLKSGAIIVSSYMIQGIVGLGISLLLAYTCMPKLFKASGILLPMGYGQGPGQANNFGTTFENQYGFVGGHSFGLALAAAGYLSACIVGILFINYLIRKGKVKRIENVAVSGSAVTVDPSPKDEEVSESLDRLSLQVALVIGIYLLTYVLTLGTTRLLTFINEGLGNTLNSLLWGFNFMIGSGLAIAVRNILQVQHHHKMMDVQLQDNYLLNRISGMAFDIMILAGIGSIEVEELSGLWIPFLLMAVAGAIVTLIHLLFVCRHVYKDYYYEGVLSMYGMMTGTISSGVLLLREIDPKLKTPAANNLIVGSSYAILLGALMLVFVGMAPKSTKMTLITFGLVIAYYLVLIGIVRIRDKKNNTESTQESSTEDVK